MGMCKDCAHCKGCRELVKGRWRYFYICTLNYYDEHYYCTVVEGNKTCKEFFAKR